MKPEQALKHLLKWSNIIYEMCVNKNTRKFFKEADKCVHAHFIQSSGEYCIFISGVSLIVFYEERESGKLVIKYEQISKNCDEDGMHDVLYSLTYNKHNYLYGAYADFWDMFNFEFTLKYGVVNE